MAELNTIFGPGAGRRYPEDLMRLRDRAETSAVHATEPDPLMAFESENPAPQAGPRRAACVRSSSADADLAKAVASVRAARQQHRITLKHALGLAAAGALAVVAIGGWRAGRAEPLLTPVAVIGPVGVEPQQIVQFTAAGHSSAAGAEALASARSHPLASEGQLVVVSEPPGARVIVNDIGWGDTPLTIRYLPLGEKRVLVTRPGYVSQERSVRLEPEQSSTTVRVTLHPQE